MGGLELLTIGRISVDLYAEQVGASLAEARTFAKSVGGSPTNVAAIDQPTVAVGNRRECEVAVGTGDADAAADALLARGVELAVVMLGGDGVFCATREERACVEPVPAEVVCGLGAGDAFGGALCHGLLTGMTAGDAVRFANVAGAMTAGRLLCADAMPTEREVGDVLETSGARA